MGFIFEEEGHRRDKTDQLFVLHGISRMFLRRLLFRGRIPRLIHCLHDSDRHDVVPDEGRAHFMPHRPIVRATADKGRNQQAISLALHCALVRSRVYQRHSAMIKSRQ